MARTVCRKILNSALANLGPLFCHRLIGRYAPDGVLSRIEQCLAIPPPDQIARMRGNGIAVLALAVQFPDTDLVMHGSAESPEKCKAASVRGDGNVTVAI